MGKRLLFAAIGLIALLAVPASAQAQSVGFCSFGFCGGVDVFAFPGFAQVRVCTNITPPVGLPVACRGAIGADVPVPHGQPTPPIPLVLGGCQYVFPFGAPLPPLPVPTGDTVIALCV